MPRHAFAQVDRLIRALVSLGLLIGLTGAPWPLPIAPAAADTLLQPGTETPTPGATATGTETATATVTATPTVLVKATATSTAIASDTPAAKATEIPTLDLATASPKESNTPTELAVKPTLTETATATPRASATPTATASMAPSETPTQSPSALPSATLAATEPVTGTLSEVIDPAKEAVVSSSKDGITLTVPTGAFTVPVQISIAAVDLNAAKLGSPDGISIERALDLVARVADKAEPTATPDGKPADDAAGGIQDASADQIIDKFAKPLDVELDITDLVNNDPTGLGKMWVGYFDEKAGQWIGVDFTRDVRPDGRIMAVFQTDHFTIYGSGFGTIAGWIPTFVQPNVAQFSGAATYSYPLALPEGRAGLTPSLALSYNSRAVDGIVAWTQGSEVGLGWTLGTPMISRPFKGQGDGDAPPSAGCYAPGEEGEVFHLQVGGAGYVLVKATDSPPGYAHYVTQEKSGLYIERHNTALTPAGEPIAPNQTGEYWIVRMPDGTVYRFGWNTDAELLVRRGTNCNTTDPRATNYVGDNNPADGLALMWMVDAVWDNHSYTTGAGLMHNFVRYEYETDKACHHTQYPITVGAGGEDVGGHPYLEKAIYLKQILYNRDLVGAWYHSKVEFTLPWRTNAGSENGWGSVTDAFLGPKCGTGNVDGGLTADLLHQSRYVSSISILSADVLLHRYDLTYAAQTNHALGTPAHPDEATRRLNSILEYGRGGVGPLPATSFGYRMDDNKEKDNQNDWGSTGFGYSRLNEVNNGYGGRVVYGIATTIDRPYTNETRYYRVTTQDIYDGIHAGFARTTYEYAGVCFRNGNPGTWGLTVTPVNNQGGCPNIFPNPNSSELAGYQTVTTRSYDYGTWSPSAPTQLSTVRSTYYTQEWGSQLAGREKKVEVMNGAGTEVYSIAETSYYDANADGDGDARTYQARVEYVRNSRCTGSPSSPSCVGNRTTYTMYDVFENPRVIKEYAALDATTVYRTTEIAYAITNLVVDTSRPQWGAGQRVYIVNRPYVVVTWLGDGPDYPNQNTKLIARTVYQYDSPDAPTNQPLKGDLAVVTVQTWAPAIGGNTGPNYPSPATQTRTWYNAYGQPYQVRDYAGKGVNYGYDGPYLNLATITNTAAGLSMSAYIDPVTRKVRSVTDESGQTTCYAYDPFSRLLAVYKPGDYTGGCPAEDTAFTTARDPSIYYKYYDSNWNSFVTAYTNGIGTGVQPYVGTVTKPATFAFAVSVRQLYDGWGRLVQTHTSHDASINGVNSDILISSGYDGLGRQTYQTVPYAIPAVGGGINPYSTTNLVAAARTTTTYNAAGWVLTSVGPNGAQSEHHYGAVDEYGQLLFYDDVIDPNRHRVQTRTDAFGRLTSVYEHRGDCNGWTYNCAAPYTTPWAIYALTRYSYDVRDLLKTVTDQLNHVTELSYNPAGQKTAIDDPDMGMWSYEYNTSGNLWRQTDNRNCVTTLLYDNANRLTDKQYTAAGGSCAATANVHYTYVPQGSYGAGQRWTMTDGSGSTTLSYNQRGLLQQEQRVINGVTYTTGFAYDALDRLQDVTYPNGEVVRQSYETPRAGNVTGVQSLDYTPSYASGMTYDAEGRMTHVAYGNTVYTNYTYWPWNDSLKRGGRLQYLRTKIGSTDLQVFDYYYDQVGNLTTLYDALNGPQTLTFSYDHLNRLDLVNSSGGDTVHYDYVYDEVGNLMNGEAGAMTYGPDDPGCSRDWNGQPHAVKTAGGLTQAYDCNGNQTTRNDATGSYTQSWDQENRLTTVSKSGGGTTTFQYDGDGQRVMQTLPDGGKIVYVNRYYEVECLVPAVPLLTGPDTPIPPGTTAITWDPVPSATSYTLRIDDQSNGIGTDFEVGVTGTSYSYAFQSSRTYGLTVRADKSCNNLHSAFSAVRTVAVSANSGATQTAVAQTAIAQTAAAQTAAAQTSVAQTLTAQVPTLTPSGPTNTPTRTPTASRTPTRTSTPTATATSAGGTACTVLDNFNRANGAIGSNWGGNTGTSYYQIASNQLDVVNTGDAGPILWNPTSFGSTQQACVKFAAIDPNADDIALVLKAQSSAGQGSGLMEVLYDPNPGAVRIWTYDTGDDWVLRGSDIAASFAAGDTLRVVARANGQVEVYKNSTLLGTRDVSAWTYSGQGGYIGLWSYNGPNTVFDDFGGGSYSGSAGSQRATTLALKVLARPISINAAHRPSETITAPTGGWVARSYYYAGGKLVAFRTMETGGLSSLHYVHTDHLSGTNLTTNANGIQEQPTVRYTPFGRIRGTATQASLGTARGFTGQYNDTSTGLMYYNARYYSPYLNRFASPDTIVPGVANPQNLNRFSYTTNNPLRLVDPSGHDVDCAMGESRKSCKSTASRGRSIEQIFGVVLEGDWSERDLVAIRAAIVDVGIQLSKKLGGTAAQAFQRTYNTLVKPMTISWGNSNPNLTEQCRNAVNAGCTSSGHLINFYFVKGSIYKETERRTAIMAFEMARNNVVHELGHAFANLWWRTSGDYDSSGPYVNIPADLVGTSEGFATSPTSASSTWQQHPCTSGDSACPHESFADMFLGWTYDTWSTDSSMGPKRDSFMTTNMTEWVHSIAKP